MFFLFYSVNLPVLSEIDLVRDADCEDVRCGDLHICCLLGALPRLLHPGLPRSRHPPGQASFAALQKLSKTKPDNVVKTFAVSINISATSTSRSIGWPWPTPASTLSSTTG